MTQVGQVVGILRNLSEEYQTSTPRKLKLIDAYLVYVLLTGIVQFAYCLLVGTFPFNSFLSGFISTVGCFILAGKRFSLFENLFYSRLSLLFVASLRIQLNKANQSTFNVSPERAFADFVFAHIILHLVVVNFIG
jgi:oligosaccharyltransferase complex subunit epsilon